jgi:ubiquinone/menaquinone biosynthesis C-methylase UbiE
MRIRHRFRPGKIGNHMIGNTLDPWQSGEPYSQFMGRWSRPVAAIFIDWLGIPAGQSWLDLGCGTGSLSQTILEIASPQLIVALDQTPGFVDYAGRTIQDDKIYFSVGTASALPIVGKSLDVLVSGLVLNFLPDLSQALAEMKAVVQPGGVIAGYVWDYAAKMEILRYFWDVALEVDPEAKDLDEGNRFPLCRPEALEEQFTEAGLEEVEVRAIDVKSVFRDFEDYWLPFLGGQGPAPGYVASLDRQKQKQLANQLQERLPFAEDGSLELDLRAWAVKGRR